MKILLLVAAVCVAVLYYTNIKTASSVLCRITGGFLFLFIYNTIAPHIALPLLGINMISAAVCGLLGLPGGVLLLCLSLV